MAAKRKGSGRAMSMPAGIGLGIGISCTATLIGAMILAWLISTERVGEPSVGWGCMIIQTAAALLGAITAARAIRHKRLMVTVITAAGYYLLLLVMALAFGGGMTGMGTTAAMVALGGGIAQFPVLFGGSSGAHKRKKVTFR